MSATTTIPVLYDDGSHTGVVVAIRPDGEAYCIAEGEARREPRLDATTDVQRALLEWAITHGDPAGVLDWLWQAHPGSLCEDCGEEGGNHAADCLTWDE